MNSILITGCNRGIGLGLVRQLVAESRPPKHLIATCRDVQKALELKEIASKNSNVHILQFDVCNYNEYDKFAKKISDIVQADGLNVLFNNAGVAPKFTRIQYVKADQMLDTYNTNTVAPILLTKTLLPTLKLAAQRNTDKPMGVLKVAVINMSSILGSISNNTAGGHYPYSCSKAALNMATKSMSIDLKRDDVLVTAIHPGWVRTEMGSEKAPLDVETSTAEIVKLLYVLNEQHNGKLCQWDGSLLQY